MADIFISYAREDRRFAEMIASALETGNLSIWWDRELIGGDNFDEVIDRELGLAKCVIVLWSQHSIHSTWVKNEASMASERDALVPVFAENVKLPLEFRHKHTIDLTAWTGDANATEFTQVRRAVAAHSQRVPLPLVNQKSLVEITTPSAIGILGSPPSPPKTASPGDPPVRYAVLMAGIFTLAVAFCFYFKGFSGTIVCAAFILAVMLVMMARAKRKRVFFVLFVGSAAFCCSLALFMLHSAAAIITARTLAKHTQETSQAAATQQGPSPLVDKAPSLPPPPKTNAVSMIANREDDAATRGSSINLVQNGSFEELDRHDAPSNWAMESWAKSGELQLDSGEHRSGAHSVKLSSSSPNHLRWVQEIPLHPRTSYLLSGWVRTEGVAHTSELDDKGASLAVRWESPTGLRFFVSKGIFGTSGDWQPLKFYFETEDASIVTIILQLGSYSGTTSGVAWFDDIHLEAVSSE